MPVCANTQDLQWHVSPAQHWFLALVQRSVDAGVSTSSGSKLSGEGLDYGTKARLDLNRQWEQTKDPQGMYVFGPDGTPYGFTNDHDPDNIQRFLTTTQARYKAHPPRPAIITAAEKRSAFSITPPAGVQVFQVFARIPSPPNTCSILNTGIGRDFCWVYPSEAKALATLAARSSIGAEFDLPTTFVRRIARFHLVDDVRGTPDMWAAGDVRQAHLRARVLAKSGDKTSLHFTGAFAIQNGRGNRGYGGSLEGECDIDTRTGLLSRFKTLADGKAWGVGTYTPNAPPGKFHLQVAVVNTSDPAAHLVPPEEVATHNNDSRYRRP